MKKFKHSGTAGDLIYSLAVTKHFGGGEFYLHLNQIDWIGQHYYGSTPNAFHRGRMTQEDFEFMKTFMEAQSYIDKFDILTPEIEITHNLDRFRPLFVGHPGNYVDIYSAAFNITDPATQAVIRMTPWLEVPDISVVETRDVVVNRTARWLGTVPSLASQLTATESTYVLLPLMSDWAYELSAIKSIATEVPLGSAPAGTET